ncbi:hypothetical protein SAMN04487820_108249 [Actinopolyspora mzabensis]|uniref:Uncharacterized protein n=1 Tax=Actinopolyspora mzabensis TaxID=995066 RepID=A0A1G9CDF0_ACTMZ|nr:hypothetical protein [Actinopolyspora mzabensis]SDK49484.1 hypothetical protein SAMN04487820_108249 [Actinopolyspora mzabensis]
MTGRTLLRTVLYGAFGSWFVGTILCQDPFRREDRIRRLDQFNLLFPDWRFFAPNPGIHDYHLLYRDTLPSGEVTSWSEIGHIEERKPHHIVWHPHRRLEKTLFDIVAEILRFSGESEAKRDMALTVPYLTLLNYITHRYPHAPNARSTQFLVAASGGYELSEEPTMLFLSESHRLEQGHRESDGEPERIHAERMRT